MRIHIKNSECPFCKGEGLAEGWDLELARKNDIEGELPLTLMDCPDCITYQEMN